MATVTYDGVDYNLDDPTEKALYDSEVATAKRRAEKSGAARSQKFKSQTVADLLIYFSHVPSSKTAIFIAFLESFTDSVDAEWSSEKVFGRMDPIAQYKGTSRKINCSFTVPSPNLVTAYYNHIMMQELMQICYPTYQASQGLDTYTIASPPLVMVRLNNLIRDNSNTSKGLLGYIPSIKYEPDMNSNIFNFNQVDPQKIADYLNGSTRESTDPYINQIRANSDAITRRLQSDKELIGFQSFKISFELNVLHTHRLGTNSGGETSENFKVFPHGFYLG